MAPINWVGAKELQNLKEVEAKLKKRDPDSDRSERNLRRKRREEAPITKETLSCQASPSKPRPRGRPRKAQAANQAHDGVDLDDLVQAAARDNNQAGGVEAAQPSAEKAPPAAAEDVGPSSKSQARKPARNTAPASTTARGREDWRDTDWLSTDSREAKGAGPAGDENDLAHEPGSKSKDSPSHDGLDPRGRENAAQPAQEELVAITMILRDPEGEPWPGSEGLPFPVVQVFPSFTLKELQLELHHCCKTFRPVTTSLARETDAGMLQHLAYKDSYATKRLEDFGYKGPGPHKMYILWDPTKHPDFAEEPAPNGSGEADPETAAEAGPSPTQRSASPGDAAPEQARRIIHHSKGPRNRKSWSKEETQNLLLGISKYGLGCWTKIALEWDFDGRTTVDLKDKWRTLARSIKRESRTTRHAIDDEMRHVLWNLVQEHDPPAELYAYPPAEGEPQADNDADEDALGPALAE